MSFTPTIPTARHTTLIDPRPAGTANHVRSWYVIHACEQAGEASELIDGQIALGMRPYLIPGIQGSGAAGAATQAPSGGLLTAWNEVREWRKLLTAPELAAFELVHAHTFAAGMAAVRSCPLVVYDIREFVESQAGAGRGNNNEATWLARSFRVAEQFVIARAGAVVVHTSAELEGVRERGAGEANVFQIPNPLPHDWVELLQHKRPCPRETSDPAEGPAFFAPDVCLREQDADALPQHAIELLEAFAMVSTEVPGVRLFVQADAACVQPLYEKASSLGVAASVHALSEGDREQALAQADVIVAVPSENAENTVLTGLLKRRAVLAADIPGARDASADGRGVLWFCRGEIRDLARRAAFLARNPDFRTSLAEAGRKHLLETRTPEAVACRYDAVYRHAWSRRRSSAASPPGMKLQPLTASS